MTTSLKKVPGKSSSPSTLMLFSSHKDYGKQGDSATPRPKGEETVRAHSPTSEVKATKDPYLLVQVPLVQRTGALGRPTAQLGLGSGPTDHPGHLQKHKKLRLVLSG